MTQLGLVSSHTGSKEKIMEHENYIQKKVQMFEGLVGQSELGKNLTN